MVDDFEPYIPPINDSDLHSELIGQWFDVYETSEEQAHEYLIIR